MLKLLAYLGLNISAFEQNLLRAQGKAAAFGSRVSGDLVKRFGALFAVGSAIQFGKVIVDTASKFHDLSVRLGISTAALQKLDFAAKQSGASVESFVVPFQRLAKSQIDALRSSGASRDAFAAMGVTLQDLKSKSVEQLFFQIAAELAKGETNALQMATAMELFGRSAGEILPAIKEGLAEAADEAERFGAVMDDLTINKLDRFGDTVQKVWSGIVGFAAGRISFLVERTKSLYHLVAGAGDLLMGNPDSAASHWGEAFPDSEGEAAVAKHESRLKTKKREKLNQTILEAVEEKTKTGGNNRSSSWSGPFDSLARIGGFAATTSNTGSDIPYKQLQVLQKIEKNTMIQLLGDQL